MSGKTPGRIAYRAHAESFTNIDAPGWNHLSDGEREAWEAAAQAAISTALAELPDSRDETDRLRAELARHSDTIARLVSEGNGLRALVAEILDHLDTAFNTLDDELCTAWRERAGLKPEFVTAGTEHEVAALNAERGGQ